MRRFGALLILLLTLLLLVGQVLADFTYIVQPGDTLWTIARRFNTTVEALVALNDLDNPDALRVGQALTIPGDPPPTPRPTGAWPTATPTNAGVRPTATATATATRAAGGAWTPTPTQVGGTVPAGGAWTPTPTRAAGSVPAASANRLVPPPRERFGAFGNADQLAAAWAAGLRIGSLIGGGVDFWSPLPEGVQRWQIVHVKADSTTPGIAAVRRAAASRPGSVWVIGNEPDVIWQDNVTPERYAEAYHALYHAIKAADPTARVAIAGVATPTPLRRMYLDRVLNAYRATHGVPLPVDIFNVHLYILNEQRDSWGAEIPPGLPWVTAGNTYEVADHGDVAEVTALLRAFRYWMAERGYRNTPLAVTEFGILMPADYGFPPPVVSAYMRDLVGFFQSASDPNLGYPADENRLVQWWFWFSISDTTGEFGVSDLYDRTTGRLTPVGQAYSSYWR